jgi:hypothetical protein
MKGIEERKKGMEDEDAKELFPLNVKELLY